MRSVREPSGPPPPGPSAKPLTPFGIEDILGGPPRPRPQPPPQQQRPRAASPLRALQELARKTFRGMDGTPGDGLPPPGPPPPPRPPPRPRRCRTSFSAGQLQALERRFGTSRYLGPAEREALAARLGLSPGRLLTWFQNRRAKHKRDLDELRADVATLRGMTPEALRRLGDLAPGHPGPLPGATGTLGATGPLPGAPGPTAPPSPGPLGAVSGAPGAPRPLPGTPGPTAPRPTT